MPGAQKLARPPEALDREAVTPCIQSPDGAGLGEPPRIHTGRVRLREVKITQEAAVVERLRTQALEPACLGRVPALPHAGRVPLDQHLSVKGRELRCLPHRLQ